MQLAQLMPRDSRWVLVNPERTLRYAEKIDHARLRIGQADNWSAEAEHDDRSQLAAWKAFQEAVECVADVASMIAVDTGGSPHDDYHNIDALAAASIVSTTTAEQLRRGNGLRNRLVHEYEQIDVTLAVESLKEIGDAILVALEGVERWLDAMTKR